jgi:hypothetical protein
MPLLIETTEANTELGYAGYCGMFEVCEVQVIHHKEFHIVPSLDGIAEARSVVLDGDR